MSISGAFVVRVNTQHLRINIQGDINMHGLSVHDCFRHKEYLKWQEG